MAEIQREKLRGPPGAATLVVLLHGLKGNPDRMAELARAARAALPNAKTYAPQLGYAGLFSSVRPENAAADLLDQIDILIEEEGFRHIVLVGHSTGSLIARKLVILAHGEQPGAPFARHLQRYCRPRRWADRIERLVLLSGLARGWSNNAARNGLIATIWTINAWIGDVFFNSRWMVLRTRAGSPFVVQTRLQWLALMRGPRPPEITTVQMLGSQDDTVAPEDTIDFIAEIAGGRFVMLELPQTRHGQSIEVEGSVVAVARRSRFMAALNQSAAELCGGPYALPAKFVTNGPPPVADRTVSDVVFVIHGIRDRGFWTQKVAHKVMATAEASGRVARSMTLSYGYLAIGPFFQRHVRREKVRWLMDRYVDSRALYPDADFHFVGHSNGTYLIAGALRDYAAARFKRVVLAGSVVRCDYDWRGAIERRQVQSVLNYVASGDWVVAIFPNGVSRFRFFDLGGAGHRGFDDLRGGLVQSAPGGASISTVDLGGYASHQIGYVAGGHSAGIKESQWDDIAAFVVSGAAPPPKDVDFTDRQVGWVRASGFLPPLAFGALVAAVLGTMLLAIALAAQAGLAWAILTALACAVAIYFLVTRF